MTSSRTEDQDFADDPANAGKVAQARERLLTFAEQFAELAARVKRKTFKTMLLGVLNLGLFGWLLFFGFDLSIWFALSLMLLVALPSGAVILVYQALDAASELPQTVRELQGTLTDIATRMVRDKYADNVQITDGGGLVARLKNGFSVLRYLASMAGQVSGIADVLSGLMFIINPLFPVVMIAGMVLTWLLALVGLALALLI